MQPEQGKINFDKAVIPPEASGSGIFQRDSGQARMTMEERAVLQVVGIRRGRENAILGPTISTMTGIKYDEVRAVISHLVNEHHCLIASYSRGYYIPITAEEVAAATKSLRHRGIMILMRAARLQKISVEDIFHQAKLEFRS